jgi:hypothetical protein
MPDRTDDAATTRGGPSCAVPGSEPGGQPTSPAGPLSGGCCSGTEGSSRGAAAIGRPARRARAVAGLGFLAIAGALSTRRLPGRVALWPAGLVPTWFGISHLVAAVTGYAGCPELGAIPSVMLGRPVATGCGPWQRIDRALGPSACRARPASPRDGGCGPG